MNSCDRWLYVGLEAVKIWTILLFGLVFSGVMLFKARPGEPTEGFLIAIAFFISAWMFWYLADTLAVITGKLQFRLILFVFAWSVTGYVALLDGLSHYFLSDFWVVAIVLICSGGFGFWEFKRMMDNLSKSRSTEGSSDSG